MKKYFMVAALSMVLDAQASNSHSAYRHPDTSYTVYEERASRWKAPEEIEDEEISNANFSRRGSALKVARLYKEEELLPSTSWRAETLQTRFEQMRDAKVIEAADGPRRLSWMYPDDGCYARAALANRTLFEMFLPVPKKVFAFGNLRVETENSPQGFVSWWYHVAPIIEVKDMKYVLDPSIEMSRPLPLKEWLSRMGTPEQIKVAICEDGTYAPSDSCGKETDGLELKAEIAQKMYTNYEKNRLQKLGRVP